MLYKKFLLSFLLAAIGLPQKGITETAIPSPIDAQAFYSVHVVIGYGSTVLYQGKPLNQDEVLNNVTVPMQVLLNGKEANIYFNPAIILSQDQQAHTIGIKPEGNNKFLLIFPGR